MSGSSVIGGVPGATALLAPLKAWVAYAQGDHIGALDRFPDLYARYWLTGMRAKLGLFTAEAEDQALVDDLLAYLAEQLAARDQGEVQRLQHPCGLRQIGAILGRNLRRHRPFDDLPPVGSLGDGCNDKEREREKKSTLAKTQTDR